MAGTFQDRLVTELRLAGATTIDDANRVLADFLPLLQSAASEVPPQHSESRISRLWTRRCASRSQPSA